EDRPASRRSHRLPCHRPGHFAVGTPHWRAALRDRRRLEAAGDHGRQPDEGAAARAAVSGGGGRVGARFVIPAINSVCVVQEAGGKIAETGGNTRGTDFGFIVRVASLFTVALVLQ